MHAATLAPSRPALLPVVHSPSMPEHKRGREARAAILAELLRRERECEPAPTTQDLATLLGLPQQGALYHCRILKTRGLVTWEPYLARTMRLTVAGREFAAQY